MSFPALTGYLGLAVFSLTVIVLQQFQTGYDPRGQFISELALGPSGTWMLAAFSGLAASLYSAARRLRPSGQHTALPAGLLTIAAICISGAGLVTLGQAAEIHIFLVATAFVACGLTMYLLPNIDSRFSAPRWKMLSWSLALAMVLAVALGNTSPAPGTAQRLATAALCSWLLLVHLRISGSRRLRQA